MRQWRLGSVVVRLMGAIGCNVTVKTWLSKCHPLIFTVDWVLTRLLCSVGCVMACLY